MDGGVCYCVRIVTVIVAATGPQGNIWPLGHRGLPLAQLGRHSLTEEAWVAEGTEVLISTVAVRFVFCILGVILGVSEGAGNLDK